jgi:hypothetical protein
MVSKEITNPTHYSRWGIEPIDFCRANNLDFIRANIIKYIMRYDAKDGLKDLEKANNYLKMLIEDCKEAEKVKQQTTLLTMAEDALYGNKGTE